MFFQKTLNRKYTIKEQKKLVRNFLLFAVPLGYGIGQILTILMLGWTEYHFGVFNFFSTLFFDILICSPFLINIIKGTKKYNYAVKFFQKNKYGDVKCLENCNFFEKDKIYPLKMEVDILQVTNIQVFNYSLNYKDIANKFELIDLKGERLKKLKKLKRRFF